MIQHPVIEGLEPDADVLTIHIARIFPSGSRARVRQTMSKTSSPDPAKDQDERVSPQKRMARADDRGGLSGRLANRVYPGRLPGHSRFDERARCLDARTSAVKGCVKAV
jgi:hypothetical protein